ncbi:MAG: hypothetical protein ABR980_07585 [Ignavibacteriaceae bacterium]|jgi:hypothetical protein
MRFFIGIVVLVSLLFLFGGLFAVDIVGDDQSDKTAAIKTAHGYVSPPVTEKYSMKQIDSLTSKDNYAFTSANAAGSVSYP